jgi:hypothetical protein
LIFVGSLLSFQLLEQSAGEVMGGLMIYSAIGAFCWKSLSKPES